jgi:hypothetical protein
MIAKRFLFIVMILIGVLALVACGAGSVERGAATGDAPLPTEEAQQVATEAESAARAALADFLGVDAEALALEKIEDAEWSDGCLGLGGPAESCLAAITPGYAITYNYDGESYVVRTDLDGNAVRVEAAAHEGQSAPPDEASAAIEAALEALAAETGTSVDDIALLSWSAEEWSDSCLGLGGPAESCLTVITPGWRLMLGLEDQVYEVRTDESGQTVRIAGPEAGQPGSEAPDPELGDAVVFYQRSGGIAGEFVTVRIHADGTVERTAGLEAPSDAVELYTVEPAAVEALLADLEEAGYFELTRAYLPADTCCDRFLYLTSARAGGEVQTVEALDGTPDTPQALWDSIGLIEAFVEAAMAG